MNDDPFKNFADTKTDPYDNALVVTPDDNNDLPTVSRAIMVSGKGYSQAVRVTFADGRTETLCLEERRVYPFRIRRVHATGTFMNDPNSTDYSKSVVVFW